MRHISKVVLIIILSVCLVFVACALLFGLFGKRDESNQSVTTEVRETAEASSADRAAFTEEASKLWYYDASRAVRYELYMEQHPDYSVGEVVWMVDADLDVDPYTDTHEVSDPGDILALVNKHFYLPEGYAPADIVAIDNMMLRKEASDAAEEMFEIAAGEGYELWVQSGFQSYEIQAALYDQYLTRGDVESADMQSVRPGYSEHQTGLSIDLNTVTDAFGETPAGKWVAENCWMFGFFLRYTKENADITLYKAEPWHLRYIGKEAAKEMHDLGIKSYEEYWVKYIKYQSQDGAISSADAGDETGEPGAEVNVPEQDSLNADGEDAAGALEGGTQNQTENADTGAE